MMPKLSTTDPTTPKKSSRTLSIADLASPLTPAMASAATALTSPAASVRSYFFTSPSAQQQQQQQAEQEEREKSKLGIQNSCYNYFYYNQAEKQNNGGSNSMSNNQNLHNIANVHVSLDDKQVLEKYGERIQSKRILAGSLQELHTVLDDAEQFSKLQQRLRDASCQTNGALKQCWSDLLRERHEDYKRTLASKEAQQRASAEALASRLDQVNLENENNNNTLPRSSYITSGSTPSPKSIMDLPFSSPSPSPSDSAGKKFSASKSAAMANAVMDLPFSTPEEDDEEEEEEEEEEMEQVQTKAVSFA